MNPRQGSCEKKSTSVNTGSFSFKSIKTGVCIFQMLKFKLLDLYSLWHPKRTTHTFRCFGVVMFPSYMERVIFSVTLTFPFHKLPYMYVWIQLYIHNQETTPVAKGIISLRLWWETGNSMLRAWFFSIYQWSVSEFHWSHRTAKPSRNWEEKVNKRTLSNAR